MRPAIFAAAALFLALATWSTFARSEERERLAERYFTREQIARGQRFAFERRLLYWSWQAAQLSLLGFLALSSTGARLLARCEA